MARLGIDFGTTNTVAVIHDRGVFSVVLHRADTGAGTIVQDVFPSAILIDKLSGKQWFGLQADRLFGQRGPGPNHVFLPSLKRHLWSYAEGHSVSCGHETRPRARDAAVGLEQFDIGKLLTGFLQS
ncbi:MAG: hypothetical protein ACUVXJ_16755, partial [Phycisphaerae bacterium]